MAKMILSTHPAEIVGGNVQIAITQEGPFPRREVEVTRFADCIKALETYKCEAMNTGLPMVVCISMGRGQRKPPGFDRLLPKGYEAINLFVF